MDHDQKHANLFYYFLFGRKSWGTILLNSVYSSSSHPQALWPGYELLKNWQLMWTEICHNNGNFKFKISSVENMCTVTVLLLGSLSKLCALSQSCSLVHCQNYVHWPSLAPSLHCRKYVHCHSLAPLFTVENMCTVTVLLLRTLSKISALSQSCSFVHY